MTALAAKIGKYRIITSIGRGGMGRVYLAIAEGPGGFTKLVVIKVLQTELAERPDAVRHFLREARMAARLDHPNIVQTYEVLDHGKSYHLVMEHLEGQALNTVLKRLSERDAQLPLGMHVRVLAEMLKGLQHAHEICDYDGRPLGIVHRDVSPHNCFITYDGQVKLIDFGVAKMSQATTSTEEGTFRGKITYAAPEQVDGRPVDPRTDLFAVGVMLWQAIANRPINEGLDAIATLHRRVTGADPPIRSVCPTAPAELVEICDRALSTDPAQRPESAAAMRTALEKWLRDSGQGASAEELGALVTGLFSDTRNRLRSLIEQALSRRDELPPWSPEHGDEDEQHLTLSTATGGAAAPLDPTVRLTPGRQFRRRRRLLAASALVGTVGVLAMVGTATRRAHTPPSESAATPTASSPALVTISADIEPAAAKVYVDDRMVSVPVRLSVPRDGSRHRLLARAPGFEDKAVDLVFDRDQRLELSLNAEPLPAASTSSKPKKPRAARGSPRATGEAAPEIDEKSPYIQ